MKKLVIVNAGLSTPSTTFDVASGVSSAVQRQMDVPVEVIDLRSLAGDLATFMTTMIPTQALSQAHALVESADAIIAATPIFQGSYSGLFKMFFDTVDKTAIAGIPVTLVATAGTARHSLVLDFAMRPLFAYLQATVLPTGVFAATDDFGGTDSLTARYERAAAEIVAALAGPADSSLSRSASAVNRADSSPSGSASAINRVGSSSSRSASASPSLSPGPTPDTDSAGAFGAAFDDAFELDGDTFHSLLSDHTGATS